MNSTLKTIISLLAVIIINVQCGEIDYKYLVHDRNSLFNDDWLFYMGDIEGAERIDFDDSNWRTVDLPHDWSIENLPDSNSPFHPEAISGVSGGFTTGGTGWYRKGFDVPVSNDGKHFYILFEGIYMNSDLWLNGRHLGSYPYGYSSFWFDITDYIEIGERNVLAVQVKNEGRNSRWYSGSGIYRHVWLRVVEPVHVAQWGTFVTSPEVNTFSTRVNIKTNINNKSDRASEVQLITKIIDQNGKIMGEASSTENIPANGSFIFEQDALVKSPLLWSVDSPNLYSAISEVKVGRNLTDQVKTQFGIRTISFDAENGFQLNGEKILLKGGCVHHDNGPLGAKAYDRAEERKIELLKASGYNSVRTAHNPPSPAFLDACDRLGMLVIDEAFDTWNERKNRQDYHLYFDDWWKTDIDNMVLRDRNHPSVIMWSTGNEIPNRHKPEVAEVSQMLTDYIRTLDTTRPVTSGVNGVAEDKDPLFATMDIAGYNYAPDKYVPDNQRVPERVTYGSESFPIHAFDYWMEVVNNPWVIGDYVWTAWDYIGEASIGWLGYPQSKEFFPWNLAYCGDIDICGWKRPQSYYRDALWIEKPVLSIFVKAPTPTFEQSNPKKESWSEWEWDDVVADWNWPGHENEPLEVHVYSSCDEVELFLNDQSMGRKPTTRKERYRNVWEAPYQQGSLKAVGFKAQNQVASSELNTANNATNIRLTADRETIKADNQDLSYITVELVDKRGVRHPKAENQMDFEITGPGIIVAVGNANPMSIESYTDPRRKLWQGRAQVIVKSAKNAGRITLKAISDGIDPAEIVITAE